MQSITGAATEDVNLPLQKLVALTAWVLPMRAISPGFCGLSREA